MAAEKNSDKGKRSNSAAVNQLTNAVLPQVGFLMG